MKKNNIDDFIKGWFIGNFNPTLFNTDQFEVALKYYKQGDFEESHVHRVATEYTVIADGLVVMNNIRYVKGDIITIEPNEFTDFECLTDVITVVVKIPCVKNDKFLE